jgi:hypothetical protein
MGHCKTSIACISRQQTCVPSQLEFCKQMRHVITTSNLRIFCHIRLGVDSCASSAPSGAPESARQIVINPLWAISSNRFSPTILNRLFSVVCHAASITNRVTNSSGVSLITAFTPPLFPSNPEISIPTDCRWQSIAAGLGRNEPNGVNVSLSLRDIPLQHSY